ncbi:MAG: hypothetical protein BWY95_01312 [Bacteroidetes bacterium ADurb.BinA104]|nr:MAG: hypothetical protein BWY95_01312 [Bacteroidetes bacterium ADurb.BinA104]
MLESVDQSCLIKHIISDRSVGIQRSHVIILGLSVLTLIEHAISCTKSGIGQNIPCDSDTGNPDYSVEKAECPAVIFRVVINITKTVVCQCTGFGIPSIRQSKVTSEIRFGHTMVIKSVIGLAPPEKRFGSHLMVITVKRYDIGQQ